jgi:hypothetical protein
MEASEIQTNDSFTDYKVSESRHALLVTFWNRIREQTHIGLEIDTDVDVNSNCKYYADNEHEIAEEPASVICGNKIKET